MPEMDKEEFKFPDEQEAEQVEAKDDKLEIEIEDDIPEEDRNREPVSAEAVQKLEVSTDEDELDKYSRDAKDKLIKMKRVWHDERRAKEEAFREQQEAVNLAKRLMDENKKIKEMLQKIGRAHV